METVIVATGTAAVLFPARINPMFGRSLARRYSRAVFTKEEKMVVCRNGNVVHQ